MVVAVEILRRTVASMMPVTIDSEDEDLRMRSSEGERTTAMRREK